MILLLNNDQRKVLADIGVASGQISAGSMVLPFLIPNLDQTRIFVIILGLISTFIAWIFSIWIVRKGV